MMAMGGGGDEIQIQSFLTSGLFGSELSFYASAALRLGTAPPLPIIYEAGWGPGWKNYLVFQSVVYESGNEKKDSQPEKISQDSFMEN
jgi:hypothetical protein